jgi:hypothetical protein
MNYDKVTIGTTRLAWPLVAAALAAMPFFAVIALRSIKRPPASAMAAPVEATAFKPAAEKPVPPAALALVSQFNAEAARGFGPSPMINRAPPPPPKPVVATPQPVPNQPRLPETTHAPAQPPVLQITSIMAASNGQMMAVINGKPRRIGDDVGNGFKVVRIEKDTGEVAIRNREGDRYVFTLRPRSEQDPN